MFFQEYTIYLLDLRLEENPSSSTPNTIWSIYNDEFDTSGLGFTIFKEDESITTTGKTNLLSLGGTENGVDYGVKVEFTYDPETSEYMIDTDSELLTLSMLDTITILEVRNDSGSEVNDWIQPYSGAQYSLQKQSTIQLDDFIPGAIIQNFTSFTVIYQFNFDYGDNNHYAEITLGSSLASNFNISWIEFDLPSGFLPDSENSKSFMFVRYNDTIVGDGTTQAFTLDYGIDGAGTGNWDDSLFIIYNEDNLPSHTKDISTDRPQITFTSAPQSGVKINVIYGIRSQYELGYGFQKVNKSYSNSVRLMYKNLGVSEIEDDSGVIDSYNVTDPSLFIGLDNSSAETLIELYNMPLLYEPEINTTFILDPITINWIKGFKGDINNSLVIKFYFVPSGSYGSYYTDTFTISLDYYTLKSGIVSNTYKINYSKDLQNIYDVFGTSSIDIYFSISQIGNSSNYIPYIILDQFDYLTDDHYVEMYANMPMLSDGTLDANAVINTPHFYSILSEPFVDSQWGESPFDLLDNSEVTVAIENLPFSSLVSVEGSSGDRSFNYLGTQETLPVNSQNFYMIPNLALFTDAYNIEEQSYQDGFVSLYYGSGTQVGGETDYDDRIYMTYANTQVDDYDSIITSGVPTSWEESFNITNQFLTTQDITVSGTALYHQLFDMTNDVIDNDDLVSILGNISGVYFGVKIPDEVNIAHIRAIGTPYEYDLSVQGFPIGDYVDGTYSNVVTEGFTQEFDGRSITELLNSTTDFSLEFASNGSKYIVFYQPLSAITQNYAQNNKLMVDYWSYHTFMEGFDYKIQEDPNDPFVSIINWTYYIEDLTTYTMHPDFSVDTSFFIEFSALSWSSANNDYIKDVQDKFTFRPVIKSNISVFYYGDDNESFSILNIVPQDQFNDSSIYNDLYIEIWQVGDPSTIESFNINLDPIIFDYIFQDENVSFYYWVNFTKIQEDLDTMRSGYTIVDDSYTYIEVNFISSRLIYELAQTPFN